jgi:pimeloyl-[acyl-carrier protein] methyl ester esterase
LRNEALGVLDAQGLEIAWERYWRPMFGPDAEATVVEHAWRTAQKIGAPAIAAGVRAFHGRADREDFLLTWEGPVALVSGEHDRPERSRRLAGRLTQGSFHRIGGVGHYLPLEAPDAMATITAGVLVSAT